MESDNLAVKISWNSVSPGEGGACWKHRHTLQGLLHKISFLDIQPGFGRANQSRARRLKWQPPRSLHRVRLPHCTETPSFLGQSPGENALVPPSWPLSPCSTEPTCCTGTSCLTQRWRIAWRALKGKLRGCQRLSYVLLGCGAQLHCFGQVQASD